MGKLQSQLITASGNFTVPSGVNSLWITMTGGGGGGGPGHSSQFGAGSGAGAGEFCQRRPLKVTSGQVIAVTIGAGGAGGAANAGVGAQGGTTTFASVNCQGGYYGADSRASGLSTVLAAKGGGPRGGDIWTGSSNYAIPAVLGTSETNCFYGGSSGGGLDGVTQGRPGGSCQSFAGGATSASVHGGPGGGGASIFGPGGDGGPYQFDGLPGGGYGAGGGGAGARNGFDTVRAGGDGASGAVLVQWVA